jgi:hypothetical protein
MKRFLNLGGFDMMKILTSAAAAMALSFFAAPAQAQATFESVYAQPAQMVDGVDIGARIGPEREIGAAPIVGVQASRPGSVYGRRHDSRHLGV